MVRLPELRLAGTLAYTGGCFCLKRSMPGQGSAFRSFACVYRRQLQSIAGSRGQLARIESVPKPGLDFSNPCRTVIPLCEEPRINQLTGKTAL